MPHFHSIRGFELEPFPFRLNRNGALDSCFDAFSSREPVSTSLENALVYTAISMTYEFAVLRWIARHFDILRICAISWAVAGKCPSSRRQPHIELAVGCLCAA